METDDGIIMKPLQKDFFEVKAKLEKELAPLEGTLKDRLEYIFKQVFKTFGDSFTYWYVDGAEEGQLGDISKIVRYGDITMDYVIFGSKGGSRRDERSCPEYVIMLDGGEWGLNDSLPKRWLFENFETELEEGKKAYIQKQAEEKKTAAEKLLQSKKNKQELIKSAKEKLSKAERKALGL